VLIDGELHQLQILDTAGIEAFAGLENQSVLAGDGYIILVYDISSMQSLGRIKIRYESMQRVMESIGRPYSMILMGNKCDKAEREVFQSDGEALAQCLGCEFRDTTAKYVPRVNLSMSPTLNAVMALVRIRRPEAQTSTFPSFPLSPACLGRSVGSAVMQLERQFLPPSDYVVRYLIHR
jgi:hypothetical protein